MTSARHTGFPPIDRIFHPSDLSEASEIAYAHALKFTLIAGAKLTVMHVARKEDEADWGDFPGVRETLERWKLLPAGSHKSAVEKLGIHVSKVMGKKANPVDSVLDYLEEHHADLVVLATHQREGRARWLHPSVAEPIARHYQAMTLFVPHGMNGFVSLEDGSATLKNIVIPVDEHPRPHRAIEGAVRVARELGCSDVTFTILHAGKEGDMPAVHPVENEGWRWKKRTVEGPVVETILAAAEETAADLVVMTTAGHHGFLDALRGSTTEQVLRHAPCPLLAIPPGV